MLDDMFATGNPLMDAERAFLHETRARRRSTLWHLLRRDGRTGDLPVLDRPRLPVVPRTGIREIPLAAIEGTLEPSRAALFDRSFRPRRRARERWERLWIAHSRGAFLPPVTVTRVGDGYAVVDGHHRISVARAHGATVIDALEG